MSLLENQWADFAKYLLAHGFTPVATAAIVGSAWGESGDSVESAGTGGNGLIGWTPARAGYVTGNVKKDEATQFPAVVEYIKTNGSIADMNRFKNVDEALAHFVSQYERPAAPGPDTTIRTPAANAILKAIQAKNWKTTGGGGGGSPAGGGTGANEMTLTSVPLPGFDWLPGFAQIAGIGNTIGDVATGIGGITNDLSALMHFVSVLFRPALWLRVGAFFGGILALAGALFMLGKAAGIGGGSGGAPQMVPIPV